MKISLQNICFMHYIAIKAKKYWKNTITSHHIFIIYFCVLIFFIIEFFFIFNLVFILYVF